MRTRPQMADCLRQRSYIDSEHKQPRLPGLLRHKRLPDSTRCHSKKKNWNRYRRRRGFDSQRFRILTCTSRHKVATIEYWYQQACIASHSRLTHGRTVDRGDVYSDARKSLFKLTAQVGSPFCAEVRPASTVVMRTAMILAFMVSSGKDDELVSW